MAGLAALTIDPDPVVQYPAVAAAIALCGLLWGVAHVESRKARAAA
jgi:hypothetical protein